MVVRELQSVTVVCLGHVPVGTNFAKGMGVCGVHDVLVFLNVAEKIIWCATEVKKCTEGSVE